MNQKYDPETKRFKVDKEEKVSPPQTENIRVDSALVNQLAKFAKEDGFDLEGTTKQSKGMKRNKALRVYVEQALTEFITARK